MADLFSILSVAARALEAQRFGLDVAGQNIANINTVGYTRRTARFAEVPPTDAQEAGRGVEVLGVHATRNRLIEARLRTDISSRDFYSASADVLAQLEGIIGLPGQSIDADMTRLFDAFARLADDPTSTVARQQVFSDAQAMAASFRAMSQRLDGARQDADQYVRQEVDAINELADRIALLNSDMAKVPADREPLHERDEVMQAIKELSEHVNVVVVERGDDRVLDVYVGSGRPLVVGDVAFSLNAVSVGPGGFADVQHNGVSIVSEITGGRLSGYLDLRDVKIPSYVSPLDELAFTLAQEVNTLTNSGFDLNGNPGGDFFVPIGVIPGAAASITVDPAVAADSNLVVAAGVAQAGDNQIARAVSDLRDQPTLSGGTATFDEFWAQLVFTVARDTDTVSVRLEGRSEAARQTEAAWDAVSAVSLDEEALQLTRFQQAYSANAVMFRTINETIDTLMNMVGV